MGTTVVATLVAADDARFTYGHVGDSRLYIIRGGRVIQLTRDDSLANSAWADTEEGGVVGAMKNVLTKALGVRGEVDFDVTAHDLVPGDTVLLCSDGLTNMLEDDAILEIISRYDGHLAKTCDQLVDSANARGGRDNISAILLRYE
jgi:protein phosphatase